MAVNYTIVPSADWPFDQCSALSRYVFGVVYSRWRLSARPETWHKWVDDIGLYCLYDQREIAREVGITLPTLRRCLDELEHHRLLHRVRVDQHSACRYYPSTKAILFMPDRPEGYSAMREDETCAGLHTETLMFG